MNLVSFENFVTLCAVTASANFNGNCTAVPVDDVADLVFLSWNSVSNLFKAIVGTPYLFFK